LSILLCFTIHFLGCCQIPNFWGNCGCRAGHNGVEQGIEEVEQPGWENGGLGRQIPIYIFIKSRIIRTAS
jgi:hypothetical protein